MTFLDSFYQRVDDHQLSINAQQGSDFAKRIAGDFNPIHDPDSKRFCVPGDLLFALTLNRFGLRQTMSFRFLDLVSADTLLSFDTSSEAIRLVNERQKDVFEARSSGAHSDNAEQIESLIKQYVAFSGHNFPHILVPLMQQHDVMINPNRPLVIYESMSIEFETLEFPELDIELGETKLDIEGKRGRATLCFTMKHADKVIGSGQKTLLLSGLRPFDKAVIDDLCADYLAAKQSV